MHFEITHIQGGMREFERTGVYPEYLLFNLSGTSQSWRVKIKKKPQVGFLKGNGKKLYEYSFDGQFFKLRKIDADGTFSKWVEPKNVTIEMRD